MILLPKFVLDTIKWYLEQYSWKVKIRRVNKEYHESYRYVVNHPFDQYLLNKKNLDRDGDIIVANWRGIGNHDSYDISYFNIYSIKTGEPRHLEDGEYVEVPDCYCDCECCGTYSTFVQAAFIDQNSDNE